MPVGTSSNLQALPLPWHLRQARRRLRDGGVIAYPTEGVWGLGCDPWQFEAVQRLLKIKRRPWEKGLILVAAEEAQIAPLVAVLTQAERDLLRSRWPEPVTWLLPDPRGWVPDWVRGNHASVAVRLSTHPPVRALCLAAGPLVSTSANRAGRAPGRSLDEVRLALAGDLDYLLPAPLGGAEGPSQIRDLCRGLRLR